jgi:transcriptional regulator with XRE-family HTH domain
VAKSQTKTKIAQLRKVLGISVGEFARFVGKSVDTMRSLESGRLALSAGLANTINEMMGVRLSWLMDNEVTGPPIGENGQELTAETMLARTLALRAEAENFSREMARDIYPKQMAEKLEALLRDAGAHPNFHLALYYTAKLLTKLEQEFVPPEKRTHPFDLDTFDQEIRWLSEQPVKAAGSKKKRS